MRHFFPRGAIFRRRSCRITLHYMDTVVTIRLDKRLVRDLTQLSKRLGRTRSDLIRDAIARHLSLLQFEESRARLLPVAERAGYLTDEDVFRDVT